MDKLTTLKIFCSAADTLQFKETANRFAVSPPVVTRTIAELESELGEPLFIRNTRQIILTEFGQNFLPKAQALLAHSETVFLPKHDKSEMRGVVRVAIPVIPFGSAILQALLTALEPYPDIVLDWHVGGKRLSVVEHQIDVGMRIGYMRDSSLIAKKIGVEREKIIVAPKLLAQLGKPSDWEDFCHRYPTASLTDENTGRAWPWLVNDDLEFVPNGDFISPDMEAVLTAVRCGRAAAHLPNAVCQPYLANGEVVELFADVPKKPWAVYVYRPRQNITPARVKFVFDELVQIVQGHFQSKDIH